MIFLSDDDVLDLAQPGDLIAAMADAFAGPGDLPTRLHCDLPGDDGAKLLVMPGWIHREAIGVKVATVMPGNGRRGRPTIDGLYVLLDGMTGRVLAVIDAPALTAVRTAAVSGLAAQWLARADARTLLMIGTGALAPHLIRAHAAVRPLDRVVIWGRDYDRARTIAVRLSGLGPLVEATGSLARAIAGADIISAATASPAPLLAGELIRPGTHVDLVGSFAPEMREGDDALLARGRLVVDTAAALQESGDLIEPLARGLIKAADIPTLADLADDASLRRRDETEITIFKTVGTGLADVAAARRIFALSQAKPGSLTPAASAPRHGGDI